MNRKQFFLLLVLLVVIGGAGLAVYLNRGAHWEGRHYGDARVLGKFDLNKVAQVVFKTDDAQMTVVKKDGIWVVRDRDNYPADFSKVGSFIQGLWQLKPVQDLKVGPSKLALLDLVAPAKGAAHASTLVELQDKDGKPVTALLVGKKYLKKSAQFPGEEGFPAGRYVMPVKAKGAVSLVSDPLAAAEVKPEAWLDKTFVRMERIQSVTVSSGSTSLKFFRDNDKAGEWKLDGLKPDEKLDTAKVPSFASMFGSPSFSDVKPASTSRDGLKSTVVVTTFDGFTYTLHFGAPEGDKVPVAVNASASFPKERTPGKDEKPADKKRLDDQFTAKTKQLEENLEKAKACEARVYLVAKATYEPLWKAREEFLKKEKPSPTPTPSATPVAPATPAASPTPTATPSVAPTPAAKPTAALSHKAAHAKGKK